MKLKITLVLVSLFAALNLFAQGQSDMRINEVLVTNTTDFQDNFGQHSAWIELFNTSYGTVNIGGCYLTNDANNLKKYVISNLDIQTRIKPRQHTLFWADSQPFRGTFHVSFLIEGSEEILFVASDGKTIIDRIKIPANLQPNQSYGRIDDGIGSTDGSGEGWEIRKWTSPSTNNTGVEKESKSSQLLLADPHGWVMAITAMSVVFTALLVLCFVFKGIGNLSLYLSQRRADKSAKKSGDGAADIKEIPAATYAAIAMALHQLELENEAHDDESLIVTIGHTDRTYSPWSSKIYGLRQTPQIKK